MKLLVSGSSGLVGSALCRAAGQRGHDVVRLVRGERDAVRSHDDRVWWDPNHEQIDMPSLSGIDGVVHLAGESIAEGRWTEAKKRRIKESRVRSTHLLSRTVATMAEPPRVLISASAVGYYGDRGDEELDETSPPGSGFLADLCQQWEAATQVAADAGVRTVMTRFGVILSPHGGALQKMLLPFKMGLGGRIGSGQQYWSWITLIDVVEVILHLLEGSQLAGPVNTVAPHPVTNAHFTRTLARQLGRPAALPMPALAARLVFGEMARELLLASQRVVPRKLLQDGFPFRHPELQTALEQLLGGQQKPQIKA